MIHELRTYTLRVDGAAAYLTLFETVGLPIARQHMKLLGYWRSMSGDPNAVLHLWEHDDVAARQASRDRLAADAEWQGTYLPQALPLIVAQNVTLMQATPFSPIR